MGGTKESRDQMLVRHCFTTTRSGKVLMTKNYFAKVQHKLNEADMLTSAEISLISANLNEEQLQ